MARVFIVRPFGEKGGLDFDKVDHQLIQPALREAGLNGGTTAELFEEAGNIREDMFRELVTADLVIADVSVHNANVFYELGIRHGLRPRATYMINAGVDRFPFDIQTDRYLRYDKDAPHESVAKLASGIKATLDKLRQDSPVYRLLPALKAPDPELLTVVPPEFLESVEKAAAEHDRGMLRLLAYESGGFEWEAAGLRAVGLAQFNDKAYAGARETYERLREMKPEDIQANLKLATIYQKLGDLVTSGQAIDRVLRSSDASSADRAEAFALKASNGKAAWLKQVRLPGVEDVARKSLHDPNLVDAIDCYARGFRCNLGHFYSGLNALSLSTIRIALAERMPDAWNAPFADDAAAQAELQRLKREHADLCGAVAISIRAAKEDMAARGEQPDQWARISEADFAFLTSSKREFVAQRYQDAMNQARDFARSSARAQLDLFVLLDVRKDLAQAALESIPAPEEIAATKPAAAPPRVVLFAGHRVDGAERAREGRPRFPNTPKAQTRARKLIRQAVQAEIELANGELLVGIAGAASGGDILFHEVCKELGIRTQVLLALPPPLFCAESVADGGDEWIGRYNQLVARNPPKILAQSKQLPRWLRSKAGYDFWERNNLWLLFNALAINPDHLSFVALSDGHEGDGPGGTRHMCELVREHGQVARVIDATELKALA